MPTRLTGVPATSSVDPSAVPTFRRRVAMVFATPLAPDRRRQDGTEFDDWGDPIIDPLARLVDAVGRLTRCGVKLAWEQPPADPDDHDARDFLNQLHDLAEQIDAGADFDGWTQYDVCRALAPVAEAPLIARLYAVFHTTVDERDRFRDALVDAALEAWQEQTAQTPPAPPTDSRKAVLIDREARERAALAELLITGPNLFRIAEKIAVKRTTLMGYRTFYAKYSAMRAEAESQKRTYRGGRDGGDDFFRDSDDD